MAQYQQNIGFSSDDAENSGAGTFDNTSGSYLICNVIAGTETQGWRWRNVPIAQGAVITDVELRFCGTWKCSPTKCSMQMWGVDEDDVDTWISGSNEPKDATKTYYSAIYDNSFNMVPDSSWGCFEIDDNVTASGSLVNIVQEIVDRAGWSSGNSIAFVTQDAGSVGRGVNFTARTYDNTESIDVPRLTIEYASDQTVEINGAVGVDLSTGDLSVVAAAVQVAVDALTFRCAPSQMVVSPGVAAILQDALPVGINPGHSFSTFHPIVVTGPVQTLVDALIDTLDPAALQVIPSGTAIDIVVIGMTQTSLSVAVVPGGVAVQAGVSTLSLGAEGATLVVATVIEADVLTLALSSEGVSVAPGQMAVNCAVPVASIDAASCAASPGATAVSMAAAIPMDVSAEGVVVEGGAVAALMEVSPVEIVPGALSIAPGTISAAVDSLCLCLETGDVGVDAGEVVLQTSPALLTPAPGSTSILPGAVVVAFDPGTVSLSSGVVSTVPGVTQVVLEAATIDVSTGLLTVGTGYTLGMDPLTLALAPRSAAIASGSVAVTVDALIMTGSAPGLGVSIVTFPDGRVVIVAVEPRRVALSMEDRATVVMVDGRGVAVLYEDKTILLSEEDRVAAVIGEDRTLVILSDDCVRVLREDRSVADVDERRVDVTDGEDGVDVGEDR